MSERVAEAYQEIDEYHAIMYRQFPRQVDREDAIQEGFRRALARPHLYDPARGSFRPWVLTIIINAARDARKSKQNRALSIDYINDNNEEGTGWPFVDAYQGPDPDPADSLDAIAGTEEAMEALNSLPACYRKILLCFAADPWVSYEGIAERLGVPMGTVRSRLSRARELLREKLGT